MIYGYIRISTKKQSLERQIKNIKEIYPEAIIVEEIFTGTKVVGREKLNRLLKIVKGGDTIVFDSVSRLSRSAEDGVKLYFDLFNKGVILEFIKEPYINTSVYADRLSRNDHIIVEDEKLNETIMKGIREYLHELAVNQIRIAFEQAEKEVKDMKQRIREGIYIAKLNGKQFGRLKGEERLTNKSIKAKKLIKKYSKTFDGKLNDIETLAMINGLENGFSLSRKTYYKYKREIVEVRE